MRAPFGRSRIRGFRAPRRGSPSRLPVQALLILSLLVSLVAPLAPLTQPAAAQQGGQLPPPLPAPGRVALSGSFQIALGCPADFDPSCPLARLQDNRDGSWSTVLPIPPGDYVFRVVASSDADRALGEGGDPNGADIFLSVPGDAAGAYFSYDSLTGDIVAEPVTSAATLVTDLGEEFAMAPAQGGGYEVIWDAQPGNYGFQILFNGQPVAQDSVSLDDPRRVIVAADDSGAVTARDTLRDTTLDVAAADASGASRPGSCFAIVDRDDQLRTQACDGDDGQVDGFVELRVPNGLEDANYTLRETFTPDGGVPAEDQRLGLGVGRSEAAAPSAGGETEEPTGEEEPPADPGIEEPDDEQPAGIEPAEQPITEPGDLPGRLTVIPVDDAGQALPGACFAVVEFGFELCDDDGDGAIVFDGIPAAPLTLRETAPPLGFAAVDDLPISIDPAGARLLVPHQAETADETPVTPDETPAIAPVETPQTATDAPGEVVLDLQDRDGNPISDGCWALTERDNGQTIERCDSDDGAEDGAIVFDTVPAGRYRLDEVTAPEGFQPADGQNIDVVEGAPVEVTVEYRPEQDQQDQQGQPGRLVIVVDDEDGNPMEETCFDLRGPVELLEVCDAQNDGRLNLPDLPPGEYTVAQTQTAEGFTLADETTVDVPDGDTIELPLVNTQVDSEEQQEVPPVPSDDSQVVVNVTSDDGAPLPGACVELDDGVSILSVCDDDAGDDNPEPGQIAIADVAAGNYFLSVTPPDGFDAPEPTTIAVTGDEDAPIEIALIPSAPDTGSLAILAEDDAGDPLPAACYTLEIDGQSFGPFCDEDGDGTVTIQGITPGPLAVTEETPPTDTAPADPSVQDIEIVAGEETQVTFSAPAEQEQEAAGAVDVRVVNGAGEPVSGCVDLTGIAGTLTACDNGEGDSDDRPGRVRLDDVPPGAYTVELSDLPAEIAPPGAQQIDVAPGETTDVELTVAVALGTLVIFVENEDAERIGGSCFTLQSEALTLTDICDRGDDGILNFPDLPSGEYTVTQTQATGNRQLASEQIVTVEPGQTVEITLLNPRQPETPTPEPEETPTPEPEETPTPEADPTEEPEPTPEPDATAEQPAAAGALSVFNFAPDGSPLGDGCFSVTDAAGVVVVERCDNSPDDFDNTAGVIQFGGLPPGLYTVTQTRAADGFNPAAPVQIEQSADGSSVELTSEPAEQETGAVEFATFDEGGNPIADLCYTLAGIAGTFGPFCDNGEGDTSGDPGVLVIEGLPTGTYEALLETTFETPGIELAQEARQRRSVSVRRGDRPTRVAFNIRAQQTQRGDLLIRVRDEDGDYLAGACFGLIADGETTPSEEVCDNRNGDENSSDGRILITGIPAGRYTLTETTAPNGYTAAPDQSVRVAAGDVREVAVVNRAEPERTATLDVETVDPEGNLLPGACYAVLRGTSTLEACDDDGDAEGITRFSDLVSGSYLVSQIQPPPGGYAPAGDTATRIDPGETAVVTMVNETQPGSLILRKTDEAGGLLAGACFALRSGDRAVYTVCDNDASDANRGAGVIVFGTVAPGTYILRETQPPAGYLAAADQEITIVADQRSLVSVVNALAPEPERNGDLRVFKVDMNGRTLAGSCFALIDGNGQTLVPRCDADDGADNGVILMEGIAPGDYTLRETRRPSASYETAPDLAIAILENQTVDVEVENRLRTGRMLIRKFDPNGVPLADACFDLADDGAGAFCTDENGELLFSGLTPSVYRLVETEAPPGYFIAPALDPVTVRPGSTTTIDVVNQPIPPPPDSGSIQVVKFVCPAPAGGGGITFVDSSDPDGGGLARTAGCDNGDAAFVLDGPSGPIEFRTGAGGRYQTTLETGDYVLTELETGASETLSVSVNTLTTVVVVNYVEPEGEEPAAIDVVKYTCAPGFQGRVWLDFAEGCLSDENLTSNVGYRLSGAVSARRVTGDAGFAGSTRFDGLPAGDYRLREETPLGAVAIYAFCGLDSAAPDGRAVGDALGLRLAAGQTVTCYWFNVPEDLAGDTGAITVYKYACPVTVPPAGFDWFGRCDPQGQYIRFSLSILDGDRFLPVITGATDGDGILRFTRLQPGTYELLEVDATWCHAESDSVTAQGNVVVEAGERASVWIFNCVGAKNPPNTGAGPMWSAGAALPGLGSAAGVGFGLLWPLAGLLALHRRVRAA